MSASSANSSPKPSNVDLGSTGTSRSARATNSFSGLIADDSDSIFRPSKGQDFGASARYSGTKFQYEDEKSSVTSPLSKGSSSSGPRGFDDILGEFGKAEPQLKSSGSRGSDKAEKGVPGFDDLLPGFGGGNAPSERSTSEASSLHETTASDVSKTNSKVMEETSGLSKSGSLKVDSPSVDTGRAVDGESGQHSDPLEETGRLSKSGSSKVTSPSVEPSQDANETATEPSHRNVMEETHIEIEQVQSPEALSDSTSARNVMEETLVEIEQASSDSASVSLSGGRMKGVVPYILGGLIQVFIGSNSIIIKKAFRADMKFTVFLCYKNTIALFALVIAALSSKRRPPVPKGLLAWIICLGIVEPFLGQFAIFAGLRFTPASFSSCLIAVGPALTFFVSWYRRLETVRIRERYSQAKLLGVLMVIGGAISVSLIDGPTITIAHASTSHGDPYKYSKNWVRGPLLVGLSVILSVLYNLLMQVITRKYTDFPLVWLNAYVVSIGALMDSVVAVALTGRTTYAWMLGLNVKLACYLYSGMVVSGLTAWLQSLVIRMKGAVFLSSFSPVATIIVMVLGFTVLKEEVDSGSIAGGAVIVTGLVVFHWGKRRQEAEAEAEA